MDVSARIVSLPLAATFTIARESQDVAELVEVAVAHDGATGYGEAAPIPRYAESADSALAFVEANAAALGDDPFAIDDVLGRLPAEQFAARAALDAALHDLQGKLLGRPVWQLLGLRPDGPPTSWTIWLGDPDDMARRAEGLDRRFRRLKLKLGGRDRPALERARAGGPGGDVPLQVDVNEYWTLDEALDAIPRLAELGVEYVEQPLPAGDVGGEQLKRDSPLPIYLDEDCHTLGDVASCAARAQGITIKLAKS